MASSASASVRGRDSVGPRPMVRMKREKSRGAAAEAAACSVAEVRLDEGMFP